MTLTLSNWAKALQVLGGLLALAALVLILAAPACGSDIRAQAAVVAALLDLGAMAIRRGDGAIPVAILKALVVVASLGIGVSCARVNLPPPPVPVDLGPSLLIASALPSVIGAVLLRFVR